MVAHLCHLPLVVHRIIVIVVVRSSPLDIVRLSHSPSQLHQRLLCAHQRHIRQTDDNSLQLSQPESQGDRASLPDRGEGHQEAASQCEQLVVVNNRSSVNVVVVQSRLALAAAERAQADADEEHQRHYHTVAKRGLVSSASAASAAESTHADQH